MLVWRKRGVLGESAAVTDRAAARRRIAPQTRTVVVVDEQPLWVAGLSAELERTGLEVLAASYDPLEALGVAQRLAPDAFVVALEMPHAALDGPELIRRARSALPETTIVALSTHSNPLYERSARAAGADAFALKTASAEAIVRVIRAPEAPHNGDHVAANGNGIAQLTPRELEILELVARGYRNSAIAKRLWVTEWTVKFHLANAYRKLGVSNRTQAARYLLDRATPSRLPE
jgi:DNA-binding NarL/FixJ family response regulator